MYSFLKFDYLDFRNGGEKYPPKSRANLAVQRIDPTVFVVYDAQVFLHNYVWIEATNVEPFLHKTFDEIHHRY
jgi:hypothetical protein